MSLNLRLGHRLEHLLRLRDQLDWELWTDPRFGDLLETERTKVQFRSLVEEHVTRACDVVTKVVGQVILVNWLNVLVVAHDPPAVLGPDDGDVVAMSGTAICQLNGSSPRRDSLSNVYDDRKQIIQPLGLVRVLCGARHSE